MLNLILADEHFLHVTTRNYHWNVVGPSFSSLHRLLAEQAAEISEWMDLVAERARALGVVARGGWSDLADAKSQPEEIGDGSSAEQMLAVLLALHEELIVQLRTLSTQCGREFNDVGSADFLISLMIRHENLAWILRSQLENN